MQLDVAQRHPLLHGAFGEVTNLAADRGVEFFGWKHKAAAAEILGIGKAWMRADGDAMRPRGAKSDHHADEVPGVAATGAAFTDATVSVIDSRGVTVGSGAAVQTDGTYSITLAADAVAEDKFLTGINFYVKGVEGKVPGQDSK